MKKFSYSTWPSYPNILVNSISSLFKTGLVNYLIGNNGKSFEKEFSKKMGIKYSAAVSNGSIALEIALLSLGIKKNDEVIVTSRSYNSSASSILRVGAKPIFCDIDSNTFNICTKSLKSKITKKTKAILCVHLYGYPCEIFKIKKIIKNSQIKIIEDCSQAHGAKIKNKPVGCFGTIGIWSFCYDKIISTGGEGGMISTNSKTIYSKIWSLKEIGKDYNKFYKNRKSINFPYIHDHVGTNARMTEVQSLIGRYQLKNLDSYIRIRNRNALILSSYLNDIKKINIPVIPKNITHAFYRYTITIQSELKNPSNIRNNIIRKIISKKIFCNVGGCPEIYNEKPFNLDLNASKNIKVANIIGKTSISFLVDNTISIKNMNVIGKKIRIILIKSL